MVVAAAAPVLLMPLGMMIHLPLLLGGRGSPFYSQVRVGHFGRPFTLFKIRTMRSDAEPQGATWAVENDPRGTRVGRFLRKIRLDELPQLWNILKGDMSLVGRRPERPEFVVGFSTQVPIYDERLLVKPGRTGWAQLNYPYRATLEDARRKLQLDLYSIKHTSLELDLIILLRTLGTFFAGRAEPGVAFNGRARPAGQASATHNPPGFRA